MTRNVGTAFNSQRLSFMSKVSMKVSVKRNVNTSGALVYCPCHVCDTVLRLLGRAFL